MNGRQGGFTLIELLVAVAIVAILATVAVASYQDHIRRSARAEAKAVLMEAVGAMERYYTAVGCYTARDASGGCTNTAPDPHPALSGLTQAPKSGEARYAIEFDAVSAQGYTLRAVPTGSYTDPECGTLTLSHTGVKGVTKAGGGAGSEADIQACWNR